MHSQRVLFQRKKLFYLSLSQFLVKDTSQESFFNTGPTWMWHILISTLFSQIEQSASHIFQFICNELNSFNISNMHNIKTFFSSSMELSGSSMVLKPRIHSQEFKNFQSVSLFLPRSTLLSNLISYHSA